MLLGLGCALVIIILDQISKYYVMENILNEYGAISFTSFFNLVRAWNTGVSFSMLNNYGNVGAWLLSGTALFIVIMLLFWLKKEGNRLVQVALGMIMGGALGNVIDRVRFGAVFDFLDVHIGDSHWPAFNAADSFICIGAALIVLEAVAAKLKNKENAK